MNKQQIKDIIRDVIGETMCDVDIENIIRVYIADQISRYYDSEQIEQRIRDYILQDYESEIEAMIEAEVDNQIRELMNGLPF